MNEQYRLKTMRAKAFKNALAGALVFILGLAWGMVMFFHVVECYGFDVGQLVITLTSLAVIFGSIIISFVLFSFSSSWYNKLVEEENKLDDMYFCREENTCVNEIPSHFNVF